MKLATSNLKKIFISTPIFYPNGKPHIGHLFTTILADYYKRVNQLKGYDAFLSTGTDEHGSKMMKTAQQAKIKDIKTLCDMNSKVFKEMANQANVSFDVFIRTTDGICKI